MDGMQRRSFGCCLNTIVGSRQRCAGVFFFFGLCIVPSEQRCTRFDPIYPDGLYSPVHMCTVNKVAFHHHRRAKILKKSLCECGEGGLFVLWVLFFSHNHPHFSRLVCDSRCELGRCHWIASFVSKKNTHTHTHTHPH